jgi:predicted ferric reductase
MHPWRLLSIPLLVGLFVALPVYWAYPDELSSWRAVGIVLGWAGSGLLLASLLLMLREVRLASWLGGIERMTWWHHWTGLAGYLVLLLHPLALAAAAWSESPPLAWQLLSPFAQNWPVWVGWAALLLLMGGLCTTFASRLRYTLWRWLHGLLGLGTLAGFGHVLLLGIDAGAVFAILAALLMLVWRLIRVDAGAAAKPYVVRSVRRVAEAMVEIALTPLVRGMPAEAGQFVLVAFFRGAHYRGCGEYHPFTISAIDSDQQFRIGVKALGDCTRRMQGLEPGVEARVQGPYGNFLLERPPKPQLWIAGGIGITPFLACLRSAPVEQATRLLYLYRGDADAAFRDELEALAATNDGLSLETHATGAAAPDLAAILPDAHELTGHECYLCGPPGLLDAAGRLLQSRGVPSSQIHSERFDFR